ncbi:60S ribosomal protein L7 [Babesia microti strain RI]|uniref:60S ribosomal protein L7 n=1 Tax=Babesia microti (strain RI) TaxID=1133968 RepID=A0A1R4AA94_BABMR|nr:60S ribosomal protein L7 [Babesia microti strain RI]SJK85918.1 60S ribosomal protein L7 [Babesia microti strain RI]|eukprot:XP_021338127.1 60S ribosomal protein L7 [Babesia microti strain RI]
MVERFLVKNFKGLAKHECSENMKKKIQRNDHLKKLNVKFRDKYINERKKCMEELKNRALGYAKEYEEAEKELIKIRRQAKAENAFFKEPDAKVIFAIRIKGINKLSPKVRLTLRLFRLLQLHNGVFIKVNKATTEMLKIVSPYIAYGYPSLATIRKLMYKRAYAKTGKLGARKREKISTDEIVSANLGQYGIHGVEDIVHEIYTVGPNFKQATNFLWPFKLSSPKKGFVAKRHSYCEQRGGDSGNREEFINELICRMI